MRQFKKHYGGLNVKCLSWFRHSHTLPPVAEIMERFSLVGGSTSAEADSNRLKPHPASSSFPASCVFEDTISLLPAPATRTIV